MAASRSQWSDLPRRLATICIGFPFVIFMLSDSLRALLMFHGIHCLACLEWIHLIHQVSNNNNKKWLFVASCMGLSMLLYYNEVYCLPALVLVSCIFYLVWYPQDTSSHCIFGFVYLAIPFGFWYKLVDKSFCHAVSLLLIVWNCDTGALLVGRLSKSVSKRKTISGLTNRTKSGVSFRKWLAQTSPSKTVMGMVGGMLGGTGTACIIPALWSFALRNKTILQFLSRYDWQISFPYNSPSQRLALGMTLSFLAILGDLVESAVKRKCGKKDSSGLIPGHGGILDRFDSSLLAVVAYYFICYMNAG